MKIILILLALEAKVLEFTPLGLKQTFWSFKEACKKMKYDSFIVDAVDLRQFNCMGHNMDASDFCQGQQNKNLPPLARGLVDKKKRQIICQWGTSAVLSVSCDKKHNRYCKNKDEGCRNLKRYYALGLESIRSVISKGEDTSILRCYYQAPLTSSQGLLETSGNSSTTPLYPGSTE